MNKPKKTKEEEPKKEKKKTPGIVRSMVRVLNGEFLSRENALNHLPFVFFLTFLLVVYIAYGYFGEKTIREVDAVNKHLKELKTEEAFINSRLSSESREAHVASRKAIVEKGLKSPDKPPVIIRLKEKAAD